MKKCNVNKSSKAAFKTASKSSEKLMILEKSETTNEFWMMLFKAKKHLLLIKRYKEDCESISN